MRLITWNIQWGKGRDGQVDLRRTADALYAHDGDVICLQEVAINHPQLTGDRGVLGGTDQVAVLAGLFPGFEIAFAAGSDLPDGVGGRRQFGNLLLSRYPMLQVFRHTLPFPADASAPGMQRVALESVLQAPGGALRVITTHLEFYSARQRSAQIEALRSIHETGHAHTFAPCKAETDAPFAVLPRGTDAILCGDFNCLPASPEWQRLQTPFTAADTADGAQAVPPAPTFIDAWCVANPERAHLPTAGLLPSVYFAQAVCLDFVFLSESMRSRLLQVVVDLGCTASDHQPVIAVFDD
jgi:endonuclease/exonuclease/phosphatase family metal-dependent hydrolase